MKENSIAEVVEQHRAKNHQFLFLHFLGIHFFALEVCEVELKVAGARGTRGPWETCKDEAAFVFAFGSCGVHC